MDKLAYRVKNWRQFQHYKDRNPPWIKLHFSLLASEDWVSLDDASRVLAVACMLVASRNEGEIDGSDRGLAYLQRVAYLNKKPNLKPLIECGFLEDASGCKQTLADACSSVSVSPLSLVVPPSGAFLRFWASWPSHERKQSQGKCWDVWRKKDFDQEADSIIAHVESSKASDGWRGGYIPAPMTYLNQRRWEGAGEVQKIRVDL